MSIYKVDQANLAGMILTFYLKADGSSGNKVFIKPFLLQKHLDRLGHFPAICQCNEVLHYYFYHDIARIPYRAKVLRKEKAVELPLGDSSVIRAIFPPCRE